MLVRVLNDEGIARFQEYLASLRENASLSPPKELLTSGLASDPFEPNVQVEDHAFDNAYQLGQYLREAFAECEDRQISRNYGLWSWLALYYFDYLCKAKDGRRQPLENAVYVLEARFSFRRYYRHAVRTPWLAVKEYGELSKVLLLMSGSGTRSEIAEQIAAYQDLFGNKTIVEATYSMYFDVELQKPKKGSGGKGPGSPRRLASIARQLELTYDLRDCTQASFFKLLPEEFRTWI